MRIPAEFQDASPAERIDFVQRLWDEIAQNPDSVPVTDEQRRILDERLRAYESDQDPGEPWAAVRDRILADIRSS